MRYVIFFAALGFLVGWDIIYNQGQYIDVSMRFMSHLVRSITG